MIEETLSPSLHAETCSVPSLSYFKGVAEILRKQRLWKIEFQRILAIAGHYYPIQRPANFTSNA
jgi:hypothetical protein